MNSSVNLTGNLVRDPKGSESRSGDPICKFDLAVSRPSRGTEETPPSYYNVTCFGSLATNCLDSLHQGSRVVVVGNIDVRVVAREDGTKATFVNVVADAVGVELRFHTVEIRAGLRGSSGAPARGTRPEPPSSRNYQFDEEPF